MPRLEQTIDAVFSDRDITPSDVPQLDLYMRAGYDVLDDDKSAYDGEHAE